MGMGRGRGRMPRGRRRGGLGRLVVLSIVCVWCVYVLGDGDMGD